MSITLPLETETMLCADFARHNRLDPGGTALAPDIVVVVETDEPWPKPAGKHESLVGLVSAVQERPEQIRLLAAVPRSEEPHRVVVFRPTVGGAMRSERLLCADPLGALHDAIEDDQPEFVSAQDGVASVLVCTQGSHDTCCGVDGEAFAAWAEARAGVEVFRVSHTGGHRFAPTAMTLPDGRMWANLDETTFERILERNDAARRELAARCRGWWGAPTGPAQIAERAVFAERGFELDELDRRVEVGEHAADGSVPVVVHVDDDELLVVVGPGREVPTIACGAPGGQPVKPGREWTVVAGPELKS